MVGQKGLRGKSVGKVAGDEAVASFLTSMALDGSRSLKELGRPPTAFEIRVYEVDCSKPSKRRCARLGIRSNLYWNRALHLEVQRTNICQIPNSVDLHMTQQSCSWPMNG
jgi:hypothetical protein